MFAVLIGILLQKSTALNNFVQSIMFTPHIISFVSVTIMWMWLLDPQMGIVNYVLKMVGLEPLKWMMSPDTSLISIILVSIWKGLGFNAMIIIAGLQGIPQYIYEAAKLDNASKWTTMFRVTLPLLSPTLLFLFITSIIGSFSSFDIVNLMTKGDRRTPQTYSCIGSIKPVFEIPDGQSDGWLDFILNYNRDHLAG